MQIDRQQFEALVKRLEGFAKRQPGVYRFRVALLAALGYAYLFLMLALSLGMLGVIVWRSFQGHMNVVLLKIGIALIVVAGMILRSLFVSFPTPTGIVLTREETPRLFAMVDGLTTALKAPRFHHLLLTEEFNAAVFQRPRLGIFGWQQNYLMLGLPLMDALTPEQFRAVLAHEFGHLSGNHSRFAGWIYRVRQTWIQLLTQLEKKKGWLLHVFQSFFYWYAPFFSAYSFVLARADEYEADRCAAQLVGANNLADALINTHLKGDLLNETFWPGIYEQVDRQAEPPAGVLAALSQAVLAGPEPQKAGQSLTKALQEQTGYADTHPALTDRLRALNCLPNADLLAAENRSAPLLAPITEPAADYFLGRAVEKYRSALENTWRLQVRPRWQQRHQYVRETQQKLETLETNAQSQPLTEEEIWEQARMTAEVKGNAAALPLLQQLVAAQPENPQYNYAMGGLLLEEGDAAGIAYLEKTMQGDLDAILPACKAVYAFLMDQGRAEEAAPYRQRFEQHAHLLELAQQERSQVTARDCFLPHGLDAEALAALRRHLTQFKDVRAAYLVRKAVTHLPDKPSYVLAIEPQVSWYESRSKETDAKLMHRITTNLEFSGDLIVLPLTQHKALGKVIRKLQGAQIYHRDK